MISILGAGAIGQLIAHKLTEASVDCQFIVRDGTNYSDSWQIIEDGAENTRTIPFSTASEASEISILLVAVKTPQLKEALSSIKHRLNADSQVILLQNGMGHEKLVHQYVAETKLFLASNTHGAYRQDSQSVNYAGAGKLSIGHLSRSIEPADWFESFKQAGLSAHWSDDVQSVLFKKLLVNAVVNPLTALYQCRNGELLSESKKCRLLGLITENQRFADAIGFEVNLKDIILEVLELTADNFNSMYQDVNKGVETEINSINGYLLDSMTKQSFAAPRNWQLWSDFHISFPPKKCAAQERAKQFDSVQFQVTQQAGTERPFTGTYNQHAESGDYQCACCDSLLFDNRGKFDSNCGWPSFDKAKSNKAIAYREDLSHGMNRTEILCAQCGSHLGHVFEDGPTETGIRYCVNSVSLNFLKQEK